MEPEISRAESYLQERIRARPGLGIILGSGLGGLVDRLQDPISIDFKEIPGFPASTVEGHQGRVVFGRLGGREVLAFSGRVHYYQGYTMKEVTIPIRVMAGLGVGKVIITSAAGAINPSFRPGDLVAISDHINLMGDNPLRGGADFVDLTEVYSLDLRRLAQEAAKKLGLTLHSGVYTAFSGPSYETPAEIRAVAVLGGDTVGMSTVPEAIMARRMGLEVLGLNLITNPAAGLAERPLSHQEVLEVSSRAGERFKALVTEIINRME